MGTGRYWGGWERTGSTGSTGRGLGALGRLEGTGGPYWEGIPVLGVPVLGSSPNPGGSQSCEGGPSFGGVSDPARGSQPCPLGGGEPQKSQPQKEEKSRPQKEQNPLEWEARNPKGRKKTLKAGKKTPKRGRVTPKRVEGPPPRGHLSPGHVTAVPAPCPAPRGAGLGHEGSSARPGLLQREFGTSVSLGGAFWGVPS